MSTEAFGSPSAALWRTDGTAGGTFEVADINPGSGGSNAFVIGVSNGIVYLSAYEPVGGQALWKTDGTAPGTVRLGGGQSPDYLTDLNGTAYFFSYDPVNASRALWKSDGTLGVGQIILIEAALDFLGLGIQPPTPSWGNMLTNAQSYFFRSGFLVALPGITIFVTVLASNMFGNAIRDAFDPRLKS